ncbi:hypothetical protein Dimus_038120 [Dionaea muscipula]
MHLGCHSCQRVESAHSRLKKHLGDTMSSLETSVEKINKMLKLQFGDIASSFEKSLNTQLHSVSSYIYNEIRCRVSLEALKRIHKQLKEIDIKYAKLVGECYCTLKITHGLPYMHDLAYYLSQSMPIPLEHIHPH